MEMCGIRWTGDKNWINVRKKNIHQYKFVRFVLSGPTVNLPRGTTYKETIGQIQKDPALMVEKGNCQANPEHRQLREARLKRT